MPSLTKRPALRSLLMVGPCAVILAACSSDVGSPSGSTATPNAAKKVPAGTFVPTPIPTTPGDGNEDLSSLVYAPHFEPDYNTLVARPEVQTATADEADDVIVTPSSLIFAAAKHPEVRDWQPGRIFTSAPGAKGSTGMNALGFARRVVSISETNGNLVVATESVGLEDIVSGDFQSTYDPATSQDVDLSKLDLEWAIANLYTNDAPAYEPSGDPLQDDWALTANAQIGDPFWGSVGRFISGAAKAVGNVVTNAVAAITPASFGGSFSLAPEMRGGTTLPLFHNMSYKKEIRGGKYPMELFIKGSADVGAYVTVNPGFQIGATIPNPINKNAPRFAAWMNVDAKSDVRVDLDVALEAGIASANGKADGALQAAIEQNAELAQDVLGRARQNLLGDPDMKPAGGWRKPVYLSRPSTKVIMAGPVPVVIVSTVQVDVECGFEAKASLNAKVQFQQVQTFKFGARYEKGGSATINAPQYEKRTIRNVNITGGGSVAVSCGLIPRINTMLYDTAGLNVGLRGSLVAKAGYESSCEDAVTTTTPKAEVAVGLYGNVGIQVGGRIQAPGSSYAGTSGQKAGFDIGPFEPWNKQFPIYEKTWQLAKGFGYCTPLCANGKKDAAETDTDCGGGACESCAGAKSCKVSSDCRSGLVCSGGKCTTAPCFDGVISGSETDVDCGGKCAAKCPAGNLCQVDGDCATGACNRKAGTGAGVCVADHCGNNVQDADESGVDCGGARCAKCATGKTSTKAADCQSGISDGTFCVATTCTDHKVSSNETDLDCGGANACRRCGVGQACTQHSDCSKGPYALLCNEGVCGRPTNPGCNDQTWTGNETDVDCGGSCGPTCQDAQMCQTGGDCVSGNCSQGKCVECVRGSQCASGVCTANACQAPACNDTVKNGDETDADCGGATCGKCESGKACTVGSDCAGGVCSNGVCSAADHLVFLSSAMYSGNLGGVAGADAKCQGLATAANLAGTFKAYIADGTRDASARFTKAPGPYKRVDGVVVANNGAAFFSDAHLAALNADEHGVVTGGEVWTGLYSGSGSGSMGCGNWTSTSGATPQVGNASDGSDSWVSWYAQFCDRTNVKLYCVQN